MVCLSCGADVLLLLLHFCPSPALPASLSLPNQLKIVDPETRMEVAAGEVGEIWLASGSVAAGYWGLPDLTKEAFSARLVGGAGAEKEQGGGERSVATG